MEPPSGREELQLRSIVEGLTATNSPISGVPHYDGIRRYLIYECRCHEDTDGTLNSSLYFKRKGRRFTHDN